MQVWGVEREILLHSPALGQMGSTGVDEKVMSCMLPHVCSVLPQETSFSLPWASDLGAC